MESRDTSKPSDTVEAVHRLKEEIDKLTEHYDERRTRILRLVHDLAVLEESQ
jgi:hypothetical protein